MNKAKQVLEVLDYVLPKGTLLDAEIENMTGRIVGLLTGLDATQAALKMHDFENALTNIYWASEYPGIAKALEYKERGKEVVEKFVWEYSQLLVSNPTIDQVNNFLSSKNLPTIDPESIIGFGFLR